MMKGERLRLFFAILPPAELITLINLTIQDLKQSIPSEKIQWTMLNDLHITLQFLAGVQRQHLATLISKVRKQLKLVSPFQLQLGHPILFPSQKHPNFIVLTIQSQIELALLSYEIGEAIRASGYPIENRHFKGHMTLARMHGSMIHEDQLKHIHLPDFPAITVNKIDLIESRPAHKKSNYVSLTKISLKNHLKRM